MKETFRMRITLKIISQNPNFCRKMKNNLGIERKWWFWPIALCMRHKKKTKEIMKLFTYNLSFKNRK